MNLYDDFKNQLKNRLLESLDIEEKKDSGKGDTAKEFFNTMMKKDPPHDEDGQRMLPEPVYEAWKNFLIRLGVDPNAPFGVGGPELEEDKEFFNTMMKKDPPPTLPDDRKINLLSLWKKFLKRMGADGSPQTEGKTLKENFQRLAGLRPLYEQLSDWEECQRVVDTDGFDSYEQASQQCCAKCATGSVAEDDQCFGFCQERCCDIDEPCEEPEGGCPEGLVWNPSLCHCDPEGIDEDPCAIFNAQTNPAWKESICKACENGTENEYQANYCECCKTACYGCVNGSPVGYMFPYSKGCPPQWTPNYEQLIANTNNCRPNVGNQSSDPGKLTGRRVINRK
jgi:hypothetical protein